MKKVSKIFAIDFDGTLTMENEFPNIGMMDDFMIEFVKELQKAGHKTILWTCRSNKDLDNAVDKLRSEGLIFDSINDHLPEILEKGWGQGSKVFADHYIDDAAICCKGHLYDYVSKLANKYLDDESMIRLGFEEFDENDIDINNILDSLGLTKDDIEIIDLSKSTDKNIN